MLSNKFMQELGKFLSNYDYGPEVTTAAVQQTFQQNLYPDRLDKTLPLVRIYRLENLAGATRGIITIDGSLDNFVTLELPWINNQKNVSCIPTGAYRVDMRTNDAKYGKVYEVKNVSDRSGILIHVGNTVDDVQGCILIGTSYGVLSNKPAVLSSKTAITAFQTKMQEKSFELQIISV